MDNQRNVQINNLKRKIIHKTDMKHHMNLLGENKSTEQDDLQVRSEQKFISKNS